jgi:sporulation protein YlmC with PRC-barrel domain
MQDVSANHDQIRASRVKGTDVYNPSGDHLGHIDDIILTKREGRAAYAIMSFGGFLGLGEQYHPLPWDSLNYDPSRGGYVVDVSREQLEGAPSYAPQDEPDWNDPEYARRIRGYYGYPLL